MIYRLGTAFRLRTIYKSSTNCGAANPGCSRLSGGFGHTGTRPTKLLSTGHQPRLYRILLNIVLNPRKLHLRPNQMVIALILPKRFSANPQDLISLVSSKPLQRPQPLSGADMRRHKHMDVVRHNDKRVQLIPLKSSIPSLQSPNNQLRNLWPPQKKRARVSCVQKSIHSHERPASRAKRIRSKYSINRQTSMQAESDKQSFPYYIPMRQPTFVMLHPMMLWWNRSDVLKVTKKPPERRLQPGLAAPQVLIKNR